MVLRTLAYTLVVSTFAFVAACSLTPTSIGWNRGTLYTYATPYELVAEVVQALQRRGIRVADPVYEDEKATIRFDRLFVRGSATIEWTGRGQKGEYHWRYSIRSHATDSDKDQRREVKRALLSVLDP